MAFTTSRGTKVCMRYCAQRSLVAVYSLSKRLLCGVCNPS